MDSFIKPKREEMDIYKKKSIIVHMIETLSFANEGEEVVIHTIEGDEIIKAGSDFFVMIGPSNDVYPFKRQMFEERYEIIEKSDAEALYLKEVADKNGWNPVYIKGCRAKKDYYIYAKQIDHEFSVYVKSCENWITGKMGDYYVVAVDNPDNEYIIDKDIMGKTYNKEHNIC